MFSDQAWIVFWVTLLLLVAGAVLLVIVGVGLLIRDWRDTRVSRGRHRGRSQLLPRELDGTRGGVRSSPGRRTVHHRRRGRLGGASQGAGSAGR